MGDRDLTEAAKTIRVVVILTTDEKSIIVLGILFLGLIGRIIVISKNKVNSFSAIIEVFKFEIIRG